MKLGVSALRRAAIGIAALFCVAAAVTAKADAGEFCPARIGKLFAVTAANGSFAATLTAESPRSVTGAFFIETSGSWYRAAFPPMKIEGSPGEYRSPIVFVTLRESVKIRNVWLGLAASDDPHWASQGVVQCAPLPERTAPQDVLPAHSDVVTLQAVPMAAPVSTSCPKPFADAVAEPPPFSDTDVIASGTVLLMIDLGADGRVVNAQVVQAPDGDLVDAQRFARGARAMTFKPAVAYCKNVPSTYFMRISG